MRQPQDCLMNRKAIPTSYGEFSTSCMFIFFAIFKQGLEVRQLQDTIIINVHICVK